MGNVQNAFEEGRVNEIFHDLLAEIEGADLSIVNLECPLITSRAPIRKTGPVLGASVRCVRGLADARWTGVAIANNHIGDHGAMGVLETVNAATSAGLAVVGGGRNIEVARRPWVSNVSGERVVIYAMAEREYSIADEREGGANPLDMLEFCRAVSAYKQGGVFIVLLHGGVEHYPYPSPEMMRRCRFMVDMGADAVVCTHAHCPLPWEIYQDRPIAYGTGNLIFESDRRGQADWNVGYLARLDFCDGRVHMEPIPYHQSRDGIGARRMEEPERMRFMEVLERRNSEVADDRIVSERWKDYCRKARDDYLSGLFGYNRVMRKAKRWLLPLMHRNAEILRSLHLVKCESHREVLETIMLSETSGWQSAAGNKE
jgi:poly-gamma-glutamate synthesis protein (capsule biosynthesis protein)